MNKTTDVSTGTTHLDAREYDPVLGRFLSVDPILDPADPQQMNGYAYANNSPVTMMDPDGLLLTCGNSVACGNDYKAPKASKSKKSKASWSAPSWDPSPKWPVWGNLKPRKSSWAGNIAHGIGGGIGSLSKTADALQLYQNPVRFFLDPQSRASARWDAFADEVGLDQDRTSYKAGFWGTSFAQLVVPVGGVAGLTGRGSARAVEILPSLPAASPKLFGAGSTGRNIPVNLKEQLAMTEVRSAPTGRVLSKITMSDSRWPAADGWVKMQQIASEVNIHYVRNTSTGAVDDFKFVARR